MNDKLGKRPVRIGGSFKTHVFHLLACQLGANLVPEGFPVVDRKLQRIENIRGCEYGRSRGSEEWVRESLTPNIGVQAVDQVQHVPAIETIFLHNRCEFGRWSEELLESIHELDPRFGESCLAEHVRVRG